MVWRDMTWPAYGAQEQEDELEGSEGPPNTEDCALETTEVSDPGSLVERRDLLCRLYGPPEQAGEPNPHVATYRRLKATAQLSSENKATDVVLGVADFGYWPVLGLGYIESVRVRADMRKKGLGQKLLKFAVGCMHNKGVRRIYSFAVNPEGHKLLQGGGFTPQPSEDPQRPWRRWFVLE